jgi:hypothetical protein
MSRRLSAVALALGILVGAMGLKTMVMAHSSTVLVANGPAPMPTRPTKPGQPSTGRF